MNYQKSDKLFKKITNASDILLNVHRSPDTDSVASALSLSGVLTDMGKKTTIISPDEIPGRFDFLGDTEKIITVDPQSYGFSSHDLFVSTDTSNWDHLGLFKGWEPPINTFYIDHHVSNGISTDGILDTKATSTCEMLSLIYNDWEIEIEDQMATILYSGIFEDTGGFQYTGVSKRTFETAINLLDSGADLKYVTFNINRRTDFDLIKLAGEYIKNLKKDEVYNFVWTAVAYDVISKYDVPGNATAYITSSFFRNIEGIDFAVAITEKTKGVLKLSLRSRTDFDVSKIAFALGGGGHKSAAGATLENIEFKKAVQKVLETARKEARAQKNELR